MPAQVSVVDHTADIGLRVVADTPAEAYCAIAEAMFGIMVNLDPIEPKQAWQIRVEGSGWEDLLVTWLEELLYRYESEQIVVRTCQIDAIDAQHLAAHLGGEELDLQKHETGVQIKAVTYHQLRAEEIPEGFVIQVIFDI